MTTPIPAQNNSGNIVALCNEIKWLASTLTKSQQTDTFQSFISSLEDKLPQVQRSNQLWIELITAKENLRALVQQCAARRWRGEWQSPSVEASLISRQGEFPDNVSVYSRDYKRESHIQAALYETEFANVHREIFPDIPLTTHLTNSGMSAMSLAFNLCRLAKKDSICAIGPTYFETEYLLKSVYQSSLIEAPRDNLEESLEILEDCQSDVVFVEPLYNSESLSTFEISKLITYLNNYRSNEVWLVVDSTCAPCISWIDIPQPKSHLKLVIVESLAKYWQYGMDLVTAGAITFIGECPHFDKCAELRARCGLYLSDIQALTLPTPNANLLRSRLKRFEENALFLQDCINLVLNTASRAVAKYSLPTAALQFRGSHLVIKDNSAQTSAKFFNARIQTMLHAARLRNIDLVHGTSFGFDHTRVYAPAPSTEFGECFLRISVGTEPNYYIRALGGAILEALADI